MTITINKKELEFAVKNSISLKKPSLAILKNIVLEIKNNELLVKSTDLETSIIFRIEVFSNENRSVMVDHKLVKDILKNLKSKEVIIEFIDNYTISINGFKLNCFDGNEYPLIPEKNMNEVFTLNGSEFKRGLNSIIPYEKGEKRTYLLGMLLNSSENGFYMVNTDNRCINEFEYISNYIIDQYKPKDLLVNKNGLELAGKLVKKEDVFVSNDNQYFYIETKSWFMSVRLLEGRFPNYKDAFDMIRYETVEVNVDDLKNVVKQFIPFFSSDENPMFVKTEGNSIMFSTKENKINVAAKTSFESKIRTALNTKMFIDLLSNYDEIINFSLKSEESPVIIFKNNIKSLIMPIKLA